MDTSSNQFSGIITKKDRIIVIGDLHADFEKTREIFLKLKLIDYNNKWTANPLDTFVVQVGDQVDGQRGNNYTSGEMRIIDFLDEIHSQAKCYNGGVYSLIGNHELMNFLGDYRYTSDNDMINKEQSFCLGTPFALKISKNRMIILKIGKYLFIHAGIMPHHLTKDSCIDGNKFINDINDLIRKLLNNEIKSNHPLVQKYFTNPNSLLWTRELGAEQINCNKIEQVTECLNIGSIIVGHTVQEKGINSKCNNKVWRVDVGLSSIFNNNNSSVLEIREDNPDPFKIIKI